MSKYKLRLTDMFVGLYLFNIFLLLTIMILNTKHFIIKPGPFIANGLINPPGLKGAECTTIQYHP
jgi:hypothetical protein